MGLERFSDESIGVDKYVDIAADYQMSVRDLVVRASASAAMVITLPSVVEAKGLLFSIVAVVATSVNTVTVVDKDDSEGWGGDYAFVFNGNSCLFYSDGLKWTALFGGFGVLSTKTIITAAEIKAIRATPITLVPALGATKVIEFVSAILSLEYGSEVFAESADNLVVRYTGTTGIAVSVAIETGGFLDQTADTITSGIPINDPIVVPAGAVDEALVLHNSGDGEITGNTTEDSVVTVWTLFRLIDVS